LCYTYISSIFILLQVNLFVLYFYLIFTLYNYSMSIFPTRPRIHLGNSTIKENKQINKKNLQVVTLLKL